MPLLRNKFQPYFPDPDAPNNYQCGPEQYCHPVTVGDTVWSQFYQTPCNPSEITDPEFDDFTLGLELVTNGDFALNPAGTWTFGAAWTWDAGNTEMDATAANADILAQTGLTLVYSDFYRVTFDVVRTGGSIQAVLGYSSAAPSSTPSIDSTGSYSFDLQYNGAIGFENISFNPTNFTGSITNVSVKAVSYDYWTTNASWNLSDGQACHILGQIGVLTESVPNYIVANGYYKLSFTVSGRTDGTISVAVANVNTGNISTNGEFTYWLTPTATGVVSIGASSTFDGCISDITLHALKNDYTAELVNSNGGITDISDAIEYYQDYVTLGFQFQDYELADDCYTLNVYDYCIVTSDNLVYNGDFVDGYDNWTRNNGPAQYSVLGNELQFKFSPFTQGFTDYVTNGDFSSGAAWTINPGWSIAGGRAVHTPGNTGTLFQTMTLPTPPLNVNYTYWVGFKVTNWTAGTINLKLGNAVNGTTYTWKGNDTFIQIYTPRQSGSVDIVFTPSSNFDGEIDDVAVVLTSGHTAFPIITNAAQPLFTTGNYQTEWEIMSSSDSNISVRFYLQGATPITTYESVVGLHSFTQSYSLSGGNVIGVANFGKTSIDYIQVNYVVGDITVDNISVKKIEPFDATYASECIKYDSNGFARSKMLVGYCDQPSFGFEFANTGFRLQQRAEIKSIAPTYPKATTIMKSGTGNARVAYSEIEKYWQVHTNFASETFHDATAAIISCDHFLIGDTEGTGVEYVAEAEDYSPNWQTDGSYSLATAVINVRVKEKGQVFNRHI